MQFVGPLDRGHLPMTGMYEGRLEVDYDTIRIGGPMSGVSGDRGTIEAIEVDEWGRRIRLLLHGGKESSWFGGGRVPDAIDAIRRYGWPVRQP